MVAIEEKSTSKTHYQRIENRVSNGMCDTFLCHDGKSVFVELKTTKNNHILLQKSQIAWNMSLFTSKGLSFFLVKAPLDLRPIFIWRWSSH